MAKIENVKNETVVDNTAQLSVNTENESSSKIEVDKKVLDDMLIKIQNLENQVNSTTNQNVLREYNDSKKELDKFAFTIKLFPLADYDCPVISWRTISNFVDSSKEKIETEQKIEVTFINKGGKEEKKVIELLHFATFLKRTDPIEAKSMKNLDGSDVAVFKQINPETKLEYYLMKPKQDIFNVTLDVNGKELTILSTYLNA